MNIPNTRHLFPKAGTSDSNNLMYQTQPGSKVDKPQTVASRIKYFIGLLAAVACLMLLPTMGFGQAVKPMVRAAVSPDSNVYVYHTFRVPVGYGVNIYRKAPGETYKKLNDMPVRGAQNALQFRGLVSEYMDQILQALELEDPNFAFHRLQADRITSNLVTFYYPDVARALGRLYVDSTAALNQKWTYKIKMVDAEGVATGDSLVKSVRPRLQRPDPPTNLELEHTERSATLHWKYPTTTRVTDDKVVRFKVYRQLDNGIQQINEDPIVRINNFNNFSLDFESPVMNDTLKLFVTAVNIATRESRPSKTLSYFIKDNVAPSVVSNVEANALDNGTVEITWPVSTEPDVEGYKVYRSRQLKGDYNQINSKLLGLLNPFYQDHPTETQQTYYYRITAVDSAGNESDRSNGAMANVKDLTPPPAPTHIQATAINSDSVRISWSMPQEADDFKTFVVLRKQLGDYTGPSSSHLNTDDLTDTVWVDHGEADINLADGAMYRYGVFAADSARNFSDTLFTSVKVPDQTSPDPPTNIRVENDEGLRAMIRWNQSTSLDVVGYRLYRHKKGNPDTLLAKLSRGHTYLQDEDLIKGNTYVYAVSAVDSLGNESDTLASEPFLMRDFQAPRQVYNVKATLRSDSLVIQWDPVTAEDLKGYRVYRSDIPTGVFKAVTDQPIKGNRFVKTGVDSISHWYKVKAVDNSGNVSDAGDAVQPYRVQ